MTEANGTAQKQSPFVITERCCLDLSFSVLMATTK